MTRPHGATAQLRTTRGVTRVVAAGEFDVATSDVLRTAVLEALATTTNRQIVADLDQVTFLDASGVRVLIEAHRNAERHHRTFRITNAHGIVARVLHLTDVHTLLTGPADDPETQHP